MDQRQREQELNQWLSLQPPFESPDSRYSIRRATPEEYPQVYALVDEVWRRERPREQYDWLYVDNPSGFARVTVVFERASGKMVAASAGFPWPIAKGDTRCRGQFGGDTVTIERLQRQNIGDIRRAYAETHPWRNGTIGLGAPNEKSRAGAKKRGKPTVFGPLPSATLPVDVGAYMAERGLPKVVARALGLAAGVVLSHRHRRALPEDPSLRVVDIERFDTSVDALSYRAKRSEMYWCPHDAEFLNWRFFAHPRFEYRALGLARGDEWVAFGVFRILGTHALIMEFVAETEQQAGCLLKAMIDGVRDSGCSRVRFYSFPHWKYWPVLHQAGFRPRTSDTYIDVNCEEREEVKLAENWQLVPSDSDVT